MWDGANGHTIQRQASVSIPVSETREAKKTCPVVKTDSGD